MQAKPLLLQPGSLHVKRILSQLAHSVKQCLARAALLRQHFSQLRHGPVRLAAGRGQEGRGFLPGGQLSLEPLYLPPEVSNDVGVLNDVVGDIMDIGPCLRWLEWERRVSVVGVGGEGECGWGGRGG